MKTTVNVAKDEIVDVFVRGNLVVGNNGTIILVDESICRYTFAGVVIHGDTEWAIGYHSKEWSKDAFKLFKGNILLEQ